MTYSTRIFKNHYTHRQNISNIKLSLNKMKRLVKSRLITLIFLIIVVLGNLMIYLVAFKPWSLGLENTETQVLCEVDYIYDSETGEYNYLVCSAPIGVVPAVGGVKESYSPEVINANRIYVCDNSGNIKWDLRDLYFPHAVEYFHYQNQEDGKILYTNTAMGGVDQVVFSSKIIEWQWLPNMINWTKILPEFDEFSYYMKYDESYGYFIINDLDFINGTNYGESYDSLLISIKHLNLIVMVNYTAEMEELADGDIYGNTSNIYWHYGGQHPGRSSEYYGGMNIRKQHNPDRMPNGNIIVADSEHMNSSDTMASRIIEINYSTKKIEWECYSAGGKGFIWAKDCNYMPETDSFIITDTGNNRVLEITRDFEVLWEFRSYDLLMPYGTKLTPNGNVLISGGATGMIVEISRGENPQIISKLNLNSNTADEHHINFFPAIFQLNASFLLLVVVSSLIRSFKLKKEGLNPKEEYFSRKNNKKSNQTGLIVFQFFMIISLFLIVIFASEAYILIGTRIMVREILGNRIL